MMTTPSIPAPGRRRTRYPAASAALVLAAALLGSACGSSSSQDLNQCGNGRINGGEQCDDGNAIDTDSCTAVCRNARCGDGAIQSGVEICDGLNLAGQPSCASLGYANGEDGSPQPGCGDGCAVLDLSRCGIRFTPTPIRPTATATATRTPTATPPSTTCGDGLLEPGETCASCPDDCEAADCTPSGATTTFTLTLSGSRPPSQVAIELAYRSSVLSIPGSGTDASVRQRVRAAPPLPQSFTVTDLDYALEIVGVRTAGLPTQPSPFATARFDVCSDAPTPTVEDLSCVPTSCRDDAGAIADCRCVVARQP